MILTDAKTLEYKVVIGTSPEMLSRGVNEAIADGWVPHCGVSVSISVNKSTEKEMYAQAVVRKK